MADKETAKKILIEKFLSKGSRVYVHYNHTTPNGTHYYDVYVPMAETHYDDPPQLSISRITSLVANATGYKYDLKREAIRTQNDANSIVHDLGRALYDDERAFSMERM